MLLLVAWILIAAAIAGIGYLNRNEAAMAVGGVMIVISLLIAGCIS